MNDQKSDNVKNWLKNLAQESWQLELLVSAFTIFLLIAGRAEYNSFYNRLPLENDLQAPISALVYIFLGMISLSLSILIFSLVCHLLLRGFWIGTIGLRSVQDHVDWENMNYSDYFTEKLRKKVRNLDELVIFLDDICSVIFSFSFLLISIILAFGLTIVVGGLMGSLFQFIADKLSGIWATGFAILSNTLIFFYFIGSIIYMIDFFTLGFFKKFKFFSRIYYPFYKIFGIITLSPVSRSIYYHLISKFTKRKIRVLYLLVFAVVFVYSAINFDQGYYFSSGDSDYYIDSNHYDDKRTDEEDFVISASVPSMHFNENYLPLFIRYNPNDNQALEVNCPDLKISDKNMWNLNFTMNAANDSNIEIHSNQNEDKEANKKLQCLCSLYRFRLNGRNLESLKFSYSNHSITNQRGIMTMLHKDLFEAGENEIRIDKAVLENEELLFQPYTVVRVWK